MATLTVPRAIEPAHGRLGWLTLGALDAGAHDYVTQQQLLRELWGPEHVEDTHYLRVVVGKIRQKLGDDPAAPRYLKTEPGVGYRFVGEDR